MADVRSRAARVTRKARRRISLIGACVLGAVVFGWLGWLMSDASRGAGESLARPDPPLGRAFGAVSEDLARFAYDVPFRVRGRVPANEVCVVYFDEMFDRAVHAQLVRRLKAEGARAIFFDVVFDTPASDPGSDEEFAAAIKDHGKVFLGAALEFVVNESGAETNRVVAPNATLRRVAAGWGHLAFRPVDPDYGVRRMFHGHGRIPSATWRMAVALGAPLEDDEVSREGERWLQYPVAPGEMANLSMSRVLDPAGTPAGFFKDRVVFVGGRSTVGRVHAGKDTFAGPFTQTTRNIFFTGVEIHALNFVCLMRGDWLVRVPRGVELWLALCFGVLAGGLLPLLRPSRALLASLAAAVLVLLFAEWRLVGKREWFAWTIPVLVQLPLVLGWAVAARFYLGERHRKQLRTAFSRYTSPKMADRIADEDISLEPGGDEVEATVMFTDLEGFTTLSETLEPRALSEVLIDYFELTTAYVLDNDGFIPKYIGDAVLAVWNTPIAQPNHPQLAARAALKLREAARITVKLGDREITLRTRVGLHLGRVLAGNLGSRKRMDFTVIGDTVNTAARLEGMNKFFGTDLLLSGALRERLGDTVVTRWLGTFLMKGKTTGLDLHELIGEGAAPEWVAEFEAAVRAFSSGDPAGAKRGFDRVLATRGEDKASRLYLARIEAGDARWPVPMDEK